MHLLRSLHFFLANREIRLTASHIPGKFNTLADALSRNHMQVFNMQAPTATHNPSTIPTILLEMLVTQQLDWCSEAWKLKLKNLLTVA